MVRLLSCDRKRQVYLDLPYDDRSRIAATRFSCTNAAGDLSSEKSICRCCSRPDETIHHLVAVCPFFNTQREAAMIPLVLREYRSEEERWTQVMSLHPTKLASYLEAIGRAFKALTGSNLFPTDNLKLQGTTIRPKNHQRTKYHRHCCCQY